MIHPQPATVLLLLARREERLSRTPLPARITTLLTRPRRAHRTQAAPVVAPGHEGGRKS